MRGLRCLRQERCGIQDVLVGQLGCHFAHLRQGVVGPAIFHRTIAPVAQLIYQVHELLLTDLVQAIHAVAEGKSFFSPAVSKVLLLDYMRKLQRSGAEDSYDLLSPREREVLQLVAEGKSNKEVAGLLNLSVFTVETHRAKIMQKLNLKGVPELILYAVRKGIIS